jgi:tetratricopeptide (TPR) repeat protein
MHRYTFPVVAFIVLLCACSHKSNTDGSLPPLNDVRANLAFTCTHEADHLPPLDPQADQLFKYARYLQTKNGPKNFDDIARYYRIAAAYGHYKANNNVQLLVSQGWASSPDRQKEVVDLASQLIDRGIPSGYNDIGTYLDAGYGLKQNKEMALRFFRKAADLGNPDAQYHVADLLSSLGGATDVARQMRRCAMEQGYGKAASSLAMDFQIEKRYPEAVQAFQRGMQAGDRQSASFLSNAFKGALSPDDLDYLALPNDPERARRYELILEFIRNNENRNPKVPDIDQIVPLPPAKLPPWDGTFQWQKEQDASPPAQPSDELIQRMSKAKNLDPTTGLPIPPPPKTALGTRVKTGERCPESGDYCAWLMPHYRVAYFQRPFRKGDTMPTYARVIFRRFELLDHLFGHRHEEVAVEWELVCYAGAV